MLFEVQVKYLVAVIVGLISNYIQLSSVVLLLWKLAIARADQTQSCVEDDVEDLVESEYTNPATSPFKHILGDRFVSTLSCLTNGKS